MRSAMEKIAQDLENAYKKWQEISQFSSKNI